MLRISILFPPTLHAPRIVPTSPPFPGSRPQAHETFPGSYAHAPTGFPHLSGSGPVRQRYRREHLIAATRTFLHDRSFQFRRRSADRTKPAVLIPINNLVRLPCLVIKVAVEMIVRGPEPHRQVNVRLNQRYIGKGRHRHRPVLHFDRKRAGDSHGCFIHKRDCIATGFLLQQVGHCRKHTNIEERYLSFSYV